MPTSGTSPQQPYGYILIVGTDDLIRELLERWLGEAGHAVRGVVGHPCPGGGAEEVLKKPLSASALATSLARVLQMEQT